MAKRILTTLLFLAAAGGAIAGAAFGPVGAAVGASIAGIGSLIVSGVQQIYKDVEEVTKAKGQMKELTEASEKMTNQLRKNVKAMEGTSVSNIQKLRLEGEKILLQKAELSDQVLSGKKTEVEVEETTGPEKYYEAVGRRKEATARVRVYTKKASDETPAEEKALIIVNDKSYFEYFKYDQLQNIVESPLNKLK